MENKREQDVRLVMSEGLAAVLNETAETLGATVEATADFAIRRLHAQVMTAFAKSRAIRKEFSQHGEKKPVV